ncbi:hypothetical protein, unknown function [Leishmania tarentolae]|uniref:Uncharacterized protein n=1 Tax=Leishmania tarentolae TaxID=5689 RepID=A0A640KD67_LEITA|nr:hypothetical protein, unknown function [Leishmania tarentolae]
MISNPLLVFFAPIFPSSLRIKDHSSPSTRQTKLVYFAMSFSTKFSMWWGSVTTQTEKLFNKEKKRLVTHEYYDNPNPKSARPKSIHSIRGSMRAEESNRSFQNGDPNMTRSTSFQQQNAYMQNHNNMHQAYPNQGYGQVY